MHPKQMIMRKQKEKENEEKFSFIHQIKERKKLELTCNISKTGERKKYGKEKNEDANKNNKSEEKYTDILEDMAIELVFNHLTNSFGVSDKDQIRIEEILNDKDENYEKIRSNFEQRINKDETRARNIVIIGAGASHDSYPQLPLGKDLIDEFKNKFISPLREDNPIFKNYEQLKKESISLSRYGFDFENFLNILSDNFIRKEDLKNQIAESTGLRFAPSLFYEIIAHLLKHCFIDVVINYNFEEILDQAIEEEINKQNYQLILSDGDCVDLDDLVVDGRLKTPVYIKPHGTYSHKSSLRFTKRHYLDLPTDLKKMLKDLIKGERGPMKPIQRVNLFVVGFNMESLELNDLLNEHLPPQSTIYHFGYKADETKLENLSKDVLPKFFEKIVSEGREETDVYKYFPLEYFNLYEEKTKGGNEDKLKVNKLTPPLGELFTYLWRRCHKMFSKLYRPRSIARHEVVSYLFRENFESENKIVNLSELRKEIDKNPKYFRDRLLVEIALELMRSNGHTDIVETLNGNNRIGEYYYNYTSCCEKPRARIKKRHSIYELFGEFCNDSYDGNEFMYAKNIFKIRSMDFSATGNKTSWRNKIHEVWGPVKHKAGKTEKVKLNGVPDRSIENCIVKLFEAFVEGNARSEKDLSIHLTILYKLLTSDLLSSSFKARLGRNYLEKVHNGLTWGEGIDLFSDTKKHVFSIKDEYPLIFELFRLFVKSAGSHYYFIRPKFRDPKNHVWESFKSKNLIHTNLALIYELREILLFRKWTHVLLVLETGAPIKRVLNDMFEKEKKKTLLKQEKKVLDDLRIGNRKVLLVASHDAVSQLFPSKGNGVDKLCELINSLHDDMTTFVGDASKETVNNCFDIMLLPSNQHNHHLVLFADESTFNDYDSDKLKYPHKKFDNESELQLVFPGAIYMYRQGSSKSINPLYMGPDKLVIPDKAMVDDMEKLLKLCFTYCYRAKDFPKDFVCDLGIYDLINGLEVKSSNSSEFYKNEIFNKLFFKFLDKYFQ